jgi:hypothetical protein
MGMGERPEFNPYEAPRAAPGHWDGGEVGPPDDAEAPIAVPHDLTDDDLKRFVDCDAFYDPLPLFGVVPQWAWLLALFTAMGGAAVLFRRSVFQWPVWAGIWPAMGVYMLLMVSLGAAFRRRRARRNGLCDGRVLVIDPRGVRVEVFGSGPPLPLVRELGSVSYRWRDVRKVEVVDSYVFFWLHAVLSRRHRLVLPLRALPDPARAEAFLRAARWWHANR